MKKTWRPLIISLFLAAALASANAQAQTAPATGDAFIVSKDKADPAAAFFGPQDARFAYDGRVNFKKPEAPALIWQASRVRVDFEGKNLTLSLEGSGGQVFLDVDIDGTTRSLEVKNGIRRYILQPTLAEGRHALTIFKRTEASAGSCKFRGLELANGCLITAPISDYRSRIIFFGDSITAGACSEDGETDQWVKLGSHNNAISYASLIGKALTADYQNIAISGMGMVTGWNNSVFAPQVWDRLEGYAASSPADLRSWTPDLVFINLGENDASYSASQGKPFPPTFVAAYIDYVKAIRAAWPRAKIVLLRGGMYNGANNSDLIAAWDRVVAEFAADTKLSSYAFAHWSNNHPRAADHQAMADELLAWIGTQNTLKAFMVN